MNEGKFYNPTPMIKTMVLFDLSRPIVDKV